VLADLIAGGATGAAATTVDIDRGAAGEGAACVVETEPATDIAAGDALVTLAGVDAATGGLGNGNTEDT